VDYLLQKATRQHTKDHNSRLVLRTIYDYGEISRADLARLTHLTRTTVSDVVGDLMEQGLVEEVGQGPTAVGRTPTLLSLIDDSRHLIAINITNTELHGAVINLRGAIRQRASLTLSGVDGTEVLEQVYGFVDDLVQSASRPLLGIGISAPGLIDTAGGIVRRAVNFGWQDLQLREIMQARYQQPVYVVNDSHTVALVEYMFGESQNATNMAAIKVGWGIGAGIVLNGQLIYGDGYGAGEIGHVAVVENGRRCKCGNYGCLETVANISALIRRAQAIAQDDPNSTLRRLAPDVQSIDLDVVLRAFLAGDAATRRIIEEIGGYLGIAVANLIGILGVRRVVITGRLAPFGQALAEAIQQAVRQRVLPTLAEVAEIEVLHQGPDTVLLGASVLLLTNELGLSRPQRREAREAEMAA
jgi:predicted NBD/HSP70 family sugar kinase